VFAGEVLGTFQLHYQNVFDQQIGEVFSDVVAFVSYCQGSLGGSPNATKGEFFEQSTLVHFLEESGAESVGDLKDGAQHAVGQRIESAFISFHRRPILMCRAKPIPLNTLLAADKRR
jgi:hypothetical protein